eukprot:2230620-Amphidinium_carterae.5
MFCHMWSAACVKAERGHLPTLRYQHKGSKRVLITREASLLTFLRATQPGAKVGFQQAWLAFKGMSPETLASYIAHHGRDQVFHATVAAGDSLLLPSGCVVLEQVTSRVSGIKIHMIKGNEATSLEEIQSELRSQLGAAHHLTKFLEDAVAGCRAVHLELQATGRLREEKRQAAAAAAAAAAKAADKEKPEQEQKSKAEEDKEKAEQEQKSKAQEDKEKAEQEQKSKAEKDKKKAEQEQKSKAEEDKKKAEQEQKSKAHKDKEKAEQEQKSKAQEDKEKATATEQEQKSKAHKDKERAEQERKSKGQDAKAKAALKEKPSEAKSKAQKDNEKAGQDQAESSGSKVGTADASAEEERKRKALLEKNLQKRWLQDVVLFKLRRVETTTVESFLLRLAVHTPCGRWETRIYAMTCVDLLANDGPLMGFVRAVLKAREWGNWGCHFVGMAFVASSSEGTTMSPLTFKKWNCTYQNVPVPPPLLVRLQTPRLNVEY